jgi:TetR/AcrR family acrAB operon transcriptional repressor
MRRGKEDSEQTRAAIMDAAELAFFAQGFPATSLEQISRAAGVTRGAFYWHFKDKTDLLAALHERSFVPQEQIIKFITEATDDDPLAGLEAAVPCILRSFEEDERQHHMFRIMSDLSIGKDGAEWMAKIHADMRATFCTITTKARDNGILQAELTPEEAAITLMVSFNGVISEWMRSGQAFRLCHFGTSFLSRQIAWLRLRDPGA